MSFNVSPEAMTEAGEIWFPCDHSRIRWWVPEGGCALVRPGVDPGLSATLGFEDDVFWACVGHLDADSCKRLYAEWVVGRPDLGIVVSASKLEVALDTYYERLESWVPDGWDRTLADAVGREQMRAVRSQFSSRNPQFCILSGNDKAPIIDSMPEELACCAESCENVGPMKRSVYANGWTQA